MVLADTKMIDQEVKRECASSGIDIYSLNNSKANTLAFSSKNRTRREFEVLFLEDGRYRISTRFLGYKKVFELFPLECTCNKDPDGRRKRYSVETKSCTVLNELLLQMVTNGFETKPRTERL